MSTADNVIDFEAKQGEQLIIAATLYGADAVANLTGATVRLNLRSRGSTTPVTLAGTTSIVDALSGTVLYTGSAADTNGLRGEIEFDFTADYGSGRVKKFPDAKNVYVLGYITRSID